MHDWLQFGTCFEVGDEQIERALAPASSLDDALPRERVFALLDRMAEVAKPRQGATRILPVLARLASCDWLEGDLEIRIGATEEGTTVDLLVNDGVLLSRLRPSLSLAVPFEELEVGVGRLGAAISPLALAEHEAGKRMALVVDYGAGASLLPEEVLAARPTARPPAEIAAVGLHKAVRRSDRPSPEVQRKRLTVSQYPEDLGHAVVAPPASTKRAAEPPADVPQKKGWGRPPEPKPTIRMKAVRIPLEAYRDPPTPPPPPPQDAHDGSGHDAPTVRPAAPANLPGVDEGSPPTDDIDDEW